MNLRPAISVPLPWLTVLIGRLFGKDPLRRRKSVFKLPRSLTITREGKWFIAVLFIIGIAAINTGNNLLYLVVASMLSFIIISGIMSESTLRGVKVKRTLPGQIFKGTPAPVRLNAENAKTRLSSFSFLVKEGPVDGLAAQPAYFLKLKPRETAVRNVSYTFGNRGSFHLTEMRVSTRFPFGLFIKGRLDEDERAVIVYPAVKPLNKKIFGVLSRGVEPRSSMSKGDGTELYNLREYTPQDDSRFIYWRSAAKTSALLLKEFEKESERRVRVILDNYAFKDGKESFETLVDEAASLVSHFSEKGFSVGLKTLTGEIPPESGRPHLYKLLKELALVSPSDAVGKPGVRVVYT